MKNLQLSVDISENSGRMDAQTNETEVLNMCNSQKCKSEVMVSIAKSEGVQVRNIGISVVSATPKQKSQKLKDNANRAAMQYLEGIGINTDKIRSYIYGKNASFALCYNAGLNTAKSVGLRNSGDIDFISLMANKTVLHKMLYVPDYLNTYDPVVEKLYANDLEGATKTAKNIWKKALSNRIVEDADQLKALVTETKVNPCCRAGVDANSLAINFIRELKNFALEQS